MVKARQLVGILENDQDADGDLDHDPPVAAADTTSPRPDVVAYCAQTRLRTWMSFMAIALSVSPLTVVTPKT